MTNSLLALGSGLLMTAYMANVMTPFMYAFVLTCCLAEALIKACCACRQFSTAVFVKAAPIVLLVRFPALL